MRSLALLVAMMLISVPRFAEQAAFPELAVPGALGVNIHFTDPKPGEIEMLAAGGFKWVRMDFSWGGTERKKGEYDFSAYDRLQKSLEAHGIRAVFILDYANRNYDAGLPPKSDEGRQAMAKWAAAAVTHFKGKRIVWEMWNEPNHANFWKPRANVEDYAKLAIEVGKAIRLAAPEELHVGPATSEFDFAFLEGCFKAGTLAYWDAVSVHPYRQKNPETAGEDYRKLRLMIAKYAPPGKKLPILSGEWGYTAVGEKMDEVRQGKYLPRQFMTNLYNEVPISIWYDWHDDGTDPKEHEHHFGTVKNAYAKGQTPVYQPKDAYKAMQTLTAQLGGFVFNKRLWVGDERDWVMLFSKGNEVRIAAWTTATEAREVTLSASAGEFEVVDYLGHAGQAAVAGKEGLKMKLSDSVTYFVPGELNDLLRIAAAWGRLPLEEMVRAPGNVTTPTGGISNPLSRAIKVGMSEDDLNEMPAQSPGRARGWLRYMDVTRGMSAWPVEDTLCVGSEGKFRQRSWMKVSNPLELEMMPEGMGRARVVVRNPSGDPFEGIVKLTGRDARMFDPAADGTKPARQDSFSFPQATGEPLTEMKVGAMLTDRAGKMVMEIPERTWRSALDLASLKGLDAKKISASLALVIDGDKKVKSEQTLTVEDVPEKIGDAAFGIGITEKAVAGLRLKYSFDAGWKFLRIAPAGDKSKAIAGKPKEMGMWVHGDGSGNLLRVRFSDAAGQVFQPGGVKLDFKDWRWVTIPLDGRDSAHWGGKGDGAIQYPIRWDTLLLLDSARRQPTNGEIWVVGVVVIE